jgi:hypothetical protein
MRPLVLVVTLVMLACSGSVYGQIDPTQATRIVDYPVDSGVQLGNGWNTVSGQKNAGTCILFSKAADKGQDKVFNFRSVTDKSALQNMMEMSAELQVKAIAYNVTGKADYVKNVEIKDEYSNFVMHAIVQNGIEFVAPLATPSMKNAEAAVSALTEPSSKTPSSRWSARRFLYQWR